jgi:hypothetical protein
LESSVALTGINAESLDAAAAHHRRQRGVEEQVDALDGEPESEADDAHPEPPRSGSTNRAPDPRWQLRQLIASSVRSCEAAASDVRTKVFFNEMDEVVETARRLDLDRVAALHEWGDALKDSLLVDEQGETWVYDEIQRKIEGVERGGEGVRSADKEEPIDDRYTLLWHGEKSPHANRRFLIDGLLLEVGTALISGAWGTYKTFIAIDLAKAVMLGTTFAGKKVMRPAGVLFIAAEGSGEIPIRLQAAYGEDGKLPFAWSEDCPRLLDRGALKILLSMAKAAHKKMMKQFNLPLGLVIIDTMAASAGFSDEASNAEAQNVMNVLTSLARQMNLLSVTVDHFGKNADSGTRGASAKEASVDGVLAVLGDRDMSGKVTNTKMVARKVRGGVTGAEFSFSKRVVDLGIDPETQEAISTCVIDWGQPEAAAPGKRAWPDHLRVFKKSLDNALAVGGTPCRPYGDEGPVIRVVDKEAVRDEFYKTYLADGEGEAKQDAKRQAFNRCARKAQELGLIGGSCDVTLDVTLGRKVDIIWLAT